MQSKTAIRTLCTKYLYGADQIQYTQQKWKSNRTKSTYIFQPQQPMSQIAKSQLQLCFSPRPRAPPLLSISRMLHVSCLFELDNDSFHNLLSWFDLVCICMLDIAIGNIDERFSWLRSLHTMDTKVVNEYEHSHYQ